VRLRRLTTIGLVFLVCASGPAAAAKGPVGIVINGPGLSQPIEIPGSVKTNPNQTHYQLVEETRFFDLMFGVDGQPLPQEPDVEPTDDVYTVVWLWNGAQIAMEIYPYEIDGPLVHMPPGLHGFTDDGGHRYGVGVRGGWVQADMGLYDLMVELGVPLDSESIRRTSSNPSPVVTVSAGAAATAALIGLAIRRRSRHTIVHT